jgi:hypothetical protein
MASPASREVCHDRALACTRIAATGPVNNPVTDAGKLFAGGYALYAGMEFIVTATLILAPMLHRMLHLFHCDERDA